MNSREFINWLLQCPSAPVDGSSEPPLSDALADIPRLTAEVFETAMMTDLNLPSLISPEPHEREAEAV